MTEFPAFNPSIHGSNRSSHSIDSCRSLLTGDALTSLPELTCQQFRLIDSADGIEWFS